MMNWNGLWDNHIYIVKLIKMCFLSSKKSSSSDKQPKVLTKPATKKAVKLVLCGNAAVGKTSITMRYKDGKFTKINEPTLAGAYQ